MYERQPLDAVGQRVVSAEELVAANHVEVGPAAQMRRKSARLDVDAADRDPVAPPQRRRRPCAANSVHLGPFVELATSSPADSTLDQHIPNSIVWPVVIRRGAASLVPSTHVPLTLPTSLSQYPPCR